MDLTQEAVDEPSDLVRLGRSSSALDLAAIECVGEDIDANTEKKRPFRMNYKVKIRKGISGTTNLHLKICLSLALWTFAKIVSRPSETPPGDEFADGGDAKEATCFSFSRASALALLLSTDPKHHESESFQNNYSVQKSPLILTKYSTNSPFGNFSARDFESIYALRAC